MKANEAPEKIYVQLPSRNWIGRLWNETPIKEGDNPNWKNATNIEYIRTEAFIKKAVGRLKHYLDNSVWVANDVGVREKEVIIEDFENYLKGE